MNATSIPKPTPTMKPTLVGPFFVAGMSWHESHIALGAAFLWGTYGLWYFASGSRARNRPMILASRPA